MEPRTIKCEVVEIDGLVELAFGEGSRRAVIYSKEGGATMVFEEGGKVEGALSSNKVSDLSRALVDWVNEQVHGADPKVST